MRRWRLERLDWRKTLEAQDGFGAARMRHAIRAEFNSVGWTSWLQTQTLRSLRLAPCGSRACDAMDGQRVGQQGTTSEKGSGLEGRELQTTCRQHGKYRKAGGYC